jgi:hypothetical protein
LRIRLSDAIATPLLCLLCFLQPSLGAASENFPTVQVSELPHTILRQWHDYKPDLGPVGRCATAFDPGLGADKEAFTCSIYVKLSAVAARKSMARCEELRVAKKIAGRCRVIRE